MLALPRIGIILLGLGIIIYFMTHSFWGTLAVLAIGYAVSTIGTIIWSLDSSGDASFK